MEVDEGEMLAIAIADLQRKECQNQINKVLKVELMLQHLPVQLGSLCCCKACAL